MLRLPDAKIVSGKQPKLLVPNDTINDPGIDDVVIPLITSTESGISMEGSIRSPRSQSIDKLDGDSNVIEVSDLQATKHWLPIC
jgi:hypothetical protein